MSLRIGWSLLAFLVAAGSGSSALRPPQIPDRIREADDYYLGRQNPDNVTKGIELLQAEVAQNPDSYDGWWRISKLIYYQARPSTGPAKAKLMDAGIDAAKKAIAIEPDHVEGHYWLGANEELISESRGFPRGLFWIDSIRKEMETANRVDPDYDRGGALRMLGRLDYRAPFYLGGDKRRSIERLGKCLQQHPDDSLAMLYLADSDMALGHREDARKQLEAVLQLCSDPDYSPELAENQEEARARLEKYFHVPKQ